MGRPSSFTQEVADAICERLAEGKSLRSICSEEGMPDQTTVFRWLRDFDSFRKQYARAREDQAETIFDEMLEIADDSTGDWTTQRRGRDEVEVVNAEAVGRSKLRVETRKWMLGKLAPKKYGEKQQIEHSGSLTLESLVAGSTETE